MTYMVLRLVREWLIQEETKAHRGGEYREAIQQTKEALARLMKFL